MERNRRVQRGGMRPRVLQPETTTSMTTWDLRSVNLDKMFAPKVTHLPSLAAKAASIYYNGITADDVVSCPTSIKKKWAENVPGQPTRLTDLDTMGAIIYVDNMLNAMGVGVDGPFNFFTR
ncbi:hypothetical protein Hanom_Chr09g00869611 [Helianthus anomalus]